MNIVNRAIWLRATRTTKETWWKTTRTTHPRNTWMAGDGTRTRLSLVELIYIGISICCQHASRKDTTWQSARLFRSQGLDFSQAPWRRSWRKRHRCCSSTLPYQHFLLFHLCVNFQLWLLQDFLREVSEASCECQHHLGIKLRFPNKQWLYFWLGKDNNLLEINPAVRWMEELDLPKRGVTLVNCGPFLKVVKSIAQSGEVIWYERLDSEGIWANRVSE